MLDSEIKKKATKGMLLGDKFFIEKFTNYDSYIFGIYAVIPEVNKSDIINGIGYDVTPMGNTNESKVEPVRIRINNKQVKLTCFINVSKLVRDGIFTQEELNNLEKLLLSNTDYENASTILKIQYEKWLKNL